MYTQKCNIRALKYRRQVARTCLCKEPADLIQVSKRFQNTGKDDVYVALIILL